MLLRKFFKVNVKRLERFVWTVQSRGDDLFLKDDDKEELCFPHVWLRDNCQCHTCFHQTSKSRTIGIEHFPFDSQPLQFKVNSSTLEVKWSDLHESTYNLSWLIQRNFTHKNQNEWLKSIYRDEQKPWTALDFPHILKRFDYHTILESDELLLKWLECLAVHGVAIVDGVKTHPGQLQNLGNRVAFLKNTYYGETFHVQAKPGTSNVAYLSGALQLHTDLPYYQYKPGVNMLHCISQVEGSGGENELSDGLAVCLWLKQHHPHHYWILSSVPVEWEDIVCEDGKQYHAIYRAPVICEEPVGSGEIVRVNWSQPQRGSHLNIPVEQVTPWYRALQMFTTHMHSEHSKVQYRMSPGEILTFNNVRILHGRTNYEGQRHLEGGYLDWDYIYSKIRVLRKQLCKS